MCIAGCGEWVRFNVECIVTNPCPQKKSSPKMTTERRLLLWPILRVRSERYRSTICGTGFEPRVYATLRDYNRRENTFRSERRRISHVYIALFDRSVTSRSRTTELFICLQLAVLQEYPKDKIAGRITDFYNHCSSRNVSALRRSAFRITIIIIIRDRNFADRELR